MLLTKDRDFYKSFFSLCFVLVLNNVIVLSVNLVDNVMLGNFSEAALSGAAACNQLQFIFQQLITGIGNTMVMMGSQHWGQKSTDAVKRLANSAVLCGLALGGAAFLLAALMPRQLLLIFTDSEAIISEGMKYLRIVKYTYPVFALTNVLLAAMKSVESVRIGFAVSVLALLSNVSLNYILIFGRLGLPAMGSEGAAIATLISRAVELIAVAVYLICIDKKLCYRIADFLRIEKSNWMAFILTGLPLVLTEGLFGVSTALQTAILGHMQDAAISASSVASSLFQLLKVAAVGCAGAAAVLIGKTIGEGRIEKTKEYAKTMQLIFVCVGILAGILLFALRAPIVSAYKISNEAKELALGFLAVLSVTIVGTSYQMPTNTGIVRGGGDAKYVLRMDLISIWGIVLPLSLLAAFVFHWHPVAVIACLNADQVFKCIPAIIKCNRFCWIKRLT